MGRTGRAYVVWRDGEPTRQFVLKLWRDDQPGLGKSVNAKEAERLRTTKAPQRMPELIERCPNRLHDCFEPVLRECLRPDPAERPGSAAEFAERLRTCRPPHHRFKAAAKWAAARLGDTRGKSILKMLENQ